MEEIARRVSEGDRKRLGETIDYNTKLKINDLFINVICPEVGQMSTPNA